MPSNAHSLLAKIALARRDYASAEHEARAALSSERPQPASLLLLADVKRAEGDYPAALEAVRAAEARARELNVPALYRLEFVRGDVLARMGDGDAAAAAYRREIAAFPQHTQAYANLAIIYFVEGRAADVQRTLEAMVAANPHPGAYALAAKTVESLDDRAGAARWRARGARLTR
jgi:tetratricopeptide (TPR) repeat protein